MSNVSFRPSDPDGGFFLSDRKGNFVKCAFDNDLNAVLVNQLPAETKHDQQETEKESLYCYRHSFADRSRYRIATQQHHKTVLLERQTGQHVAVFLNDYIHYTPEEPFATVYSTNNNHKERMELRWPVDFGFSVQSEGTEASAPPLASDNHTNPWMKCLHYVTSVSLLGDVLLVESNLGLSLIYNVEW
ncbi:hypothetical protein AGDE_12814 [Angomonas deanei]|uniref:Uncharacterized protein n=1 Tax=Angomonas deanei TaxID=59799 RepID=A0A7G2CIK5_9TRYP|nr:hypothetical protein AGDE_12814 [Angomonas deanei]CAD2218887.1 hypothetical protein, conserved [Angomonas deanei]|eukprot:EPY23490.1 hypothetical protein AGDE_12814 [Angomonas deanei]